MTGKTVGGPKILLVDDDKIVIEALTTYSSGFFRRWVSSIRLPAELRLWNCLHQMPTNMLLCCLIYVVGRYARPEVCRRMRLMDCSTPILGMTSFSLNRYRVPLAAAGAQGLVGKGDET